MTQEVYIAQLGDEWSAAERRGDVEVVREILADEFRFTSTTGSLITKEEWLKRIPNNKILRFDRSGIEVRLVGETAVLTGLVDVDIRRGEQVIKGSFRYADIFVHRTGKWQVAYSHFTPVI
jgi:hypothetical protein